MPVILQNFSLRPFNTFGIEASAHLYAEAFNEEDIRELLKDKALKKLRWLILGGGSNILLTGDFDGLVVHNRIKGLKVEQEDTESVIVSAGSGEVWHELVLFCIEKSYGGIENLSLIPGTVGAAPMQNIGAYGAELKDVFYSLEAINLENGLLQTFSAQDCRFGYRESIFKHEAKGKYFITKVRLKLHKKPRLNLSYGAIKQTLEEMGVKNITIKEVSEAVCSIRRSKLPDPAVIGNAGSFFKNPEIAVQQYEELKKDFPVMPSYPVNPEKVKVPAGWLIESCGWKGRKIGETGSHKDQALVLVNYGAATGKEILTLAKEIQQSVEDKFGILIMPEVNVI